MTYIINISRKGIKLCASTIYEILGSFFKKNISQKLVNFIYPDNECRLLETNLHIQTNEIKHRYAHALIHTNSFISRVQEYSLFGFSLIQDLIK